MELKVQLLSLFVSFLFGIFLFFMFRMNYNSEDTARKKIDRFLEKNK